MKAVFVFIVLILIPWCHTKGQAERNCSIINLEPSSVYLIDSIFIDTLYISYVFDNKRIGLKLKKFRYGVASTEYLSDPISINQLIRNDDYYVLTNQLYMTSILFPVFLKHYKKSTSQEDSCKLEFYYRIHEMRKTYTGLHFQELNKNQYLLNHYYFVFLIRADKLFISHSENDGYNGFKKISNTYLKVLLPITDL
jgi:hypothetical protein